jgi:hypothetical protein
MEPEVWSSFADPECAGRDYILIHPANETLRELKGCTAPCVF